MRYLVALMGTEGLDANVRRGAVVDHGTLTSKFHFSFNYLLPFSVDIFLIIFSSGSRRLLVGKLAHVPF